MRRQCLTPLSIIVLMIAVTVVSTGCQDAQDTSPATWQQPQQRPAQDQQQPPREQPQQPQPQQQQPPQQQRPAYPGD